MGACVVYKSCVIHRANKKTNAEYERCMKRVIQEAYSKIRCDFNKKEFLRMLENQNINTKGITSQLI